MVRSRNHLQWLVDMNPQQNDIHPFRSIKIHTGSQSRQTADCLFLKNPPQSSGVPFGFPFQKTTRKQKQTKKEHPPIKTDPKKPQSVAPLCRGARSVAAAPPPRPNRRRFAASAASCRALAAAKRRSDAKASPAASSSRASRENRDAAAATAATWTHGRGHGRG